MIGWILWGVMLLAQNASFTWVSRARNSSSVGYHAIASVFSNGIWFLNLAVAVDKLAQARASHSALILAAAAAFYTVFTVTGSITMHHVLMRYVEKGKRQIGSR